jgi:hypothetical protein
MINKIFGTKKVIDAGINTIDALVHTSEEKSKAQRIFLKLYEPYKLAQRWLATIILPPYMLCWVVAFMASFFTDTADQQALLDGKIGDTVILIAAFYFGGGAAESVFKFISRRK